MISSYYVYHYYYDANQFVILLFPSKICHEQIKITIQKNDFLNSGVDVHGNSGLRIETQWDDVNGKNGIGGNYRNPNGTLGGVGGSYYPGWFATAEHLYRSRVQVGSIIFREADRDAMIMSGAWMVREACRQALSQEPCVFSTLEDALFDIQFRLKIPFSYYTKYGYVLTRISSTL